jgi:WD40 repeat protein
MKQRRFIVLALVLILLQTSCTIRTPVASPVVLATMETNIVPEEIATATREVDALQIEKIHEWFLPAQNVKDIKWSPAGNYFVVLTEERTTLYETSTLEELWSISPIAPAYYASAATFSSDGKTLVLFTRLHGLQKRNTISGLLLTESTEDHNPANCFPSEAVDVALSIDGKSLFVSTTMEDSQQQSYVLSEIHKWDMSTLECVGVTEKIEGNARSLDLSSDGKYLALGVGLNTSVSGNDVEENGQISVRNLEYGQQVCLIQDQGSLARFTLENSILLVTDPEKDQLVYWDVETCNTIATVKGITTRYNLEFSPDGQLLAIWNNGISLIDPKSGDVLQMIDVPISDNVLPLNRLYSSLSFSPDGKHLIYAVRQEPFESMIFIWTIEK